MRLASKLMDNLEKLAKGLQLPSNLDLREEEGFGRGVFANTKIPAGTELLTDLPYVHIVSEEVKGSSCDYCLASSQ